MDVMVVGNINLDIVYEVDRFPVEHEKLRARNCHVSGGGSAANTAWWLARLGQRVRICGMVGCDLFGDFALKELSSAGIDVSLCVRADSWRTNVASIFVNSKHKTMVIGGSSFEREAERALLAALEADAWPGVGHVHVASRSREIVAAVAALAGKRQVTASAEFDGIYPADLAGLFDIVFSNEDELASAMGVADPIGILAEQFSGEKPRFFVTRGAKGVSLIEDGRITQIPACPVEPVDRTGGGDAFDAGVLAAWLRGQDSATAAAQGLALASAVIQGWGARPEIAELEIPGLEIPGLEIKERNRPD